MENLLSGYNKIEAHHTLDIKPNPKEFYMHVHDKYEILYFIKGEATFLVEGNVYVLEPDDVLIMRQSESHKIQVNVDKPYERVSIHIERNLFPVADNDIFAPFINRQLGRMNHFKKSDFQDEHYISCLKAIVEEVDHNENSLFMVGNVIALLGELKKAFMCKLNQTHDLKANDPTIRIVGFVNEHLYEDISLETVSKEFFLSVSQINRIFKKATGSTLWDYVMIKRLLAAREAIYTGMNSTLASSRCGFSDYSSFYRAYKKKFGVSPKQSFKEKKL